MNPSAGNFVYGRTSIFNEVGSLQSDTMYQDVNDWDQSVTTIRVNANTGQTQDIPYYGLDGKSWAEHGGIQEIQYRQEGEKPLSKFTFVLTKDKHLFIVLTVGFFEFVDVEQDVVSFDYEFRDNAWDRIAVQRQYKDNNGKDVQDLILASTLQFYENVAAGGGIPTWHIQPYSGDYVLDGDYIVVLAGGYLFRANISDMNNINYGNPIAEQVTDFAYSGGVLVQYNYKTDTVQYLSSIYASADSWQNISNTENKQPQDLKSAGNNFAFVQYVGTDGSSNQLRVFTGLAERPSISNVSQFVIQSNRVFALVDGAVWVYAIGSSNGWQKITSSDTSVSMIDGTGDYNGLLVRVDTNGELYVLDSNLGWELRYHNVSRFTIDDQGNMLVYIPQTKRKETTTTYNYTKTSQYNVDSIVGSTNVGDSVDTIHYHYDSLGNLQSISSQFERNTVDNIVTDAFGNILYQQRPDTASQYYFFDGVQLGQQSYAANLQHQTKQFGGNKQDILGGANITWGTLEKNLQAIINSALNGSGSQRGIINYLKSLSAPEYQMLQQELTNKFIKFTLNGGYTGDGVNEAFSKVIAVQYRGGLLEDFFTATLNNQVAREMQALFFIRGMYEDVHKVSVFNFSYSIDDYQGTNTNTTTADYAVYDNVSENAGAIPSYAYTVSEAQTLKAIAAAVYGDEQMWYVLAEANGFVAGQQAVAGSQIIIPGLYSNSHNTSETFKPYNPAEVIGQYCRIPRLN